MQEGGEAALGHVIEDEQLLPFWPQVVCPEHQQVGVADRRAGEVDGDPRRRTQARAGRGSTRGRGRGWRGGARARASEQGARAGQRRRSKFYDLGERRKGLCWVRLVPAGLTSRH